MKDLARNHTREELDALLMHSFRVEIRPSGDKFEAAQRVWAGLDIFKSRDFTNRPRDAYKERDKFGYYKKRPYRFHRPGRIYSPKARPGTSDKMDFRRKGLPPKAKLVLEIIESFDEEFVAEEQILRRMEEREEEFSTRQSLYRIFRYYRGPLRDKGFIMFGD